MQRVRAVDFTLQVPYAFLNFTPRTLVEYSIGATTRLRPVGEFEAMDLLSGSCQEPGQIMESFLVRELRCQTVERNRPVGSLAPEDRACPSRTGGVCDRLGSVLIGIAFETGGPKAIGQPLSVGVMAKRVDVEQPTKGLARLGLAAEGNAIREVGEKPIDIRARARPVAQQSTGRGNPCREIDDSARRSDRRLARLLVSFEQKQRLRLCRDVPLREVRVQTLGLASDLDGRSRVTEQAQAQSRMRQDIGVVGIEHQCALDMVRSLVEPAAKEQNAAKNDLNDCIAVIELGGAPRVPGPRVAPCRPNAPTPDNSIR